MRSHRRHIRNKKGCKKKWPRPTFRTIQANSGKVWEKPHQYPESKFDPRILQLRGSVNHYATRFCCLMPQAKKYNSWSSLTNEHNRTEVIFPVALRADAGTWSPLTGLRDHTHWAHNTSYDSCGRVISPTQWPLPDNTQHSRPASTPQAGFEPIVPASERPQTHALDRAATGTGT
jgi:hypothetical protein